MKKQRASGLVFAIILMFVILGMVVTLSSVTVLESKMSAKTKSSVGAFYNSEAGVEWALNLIENSTNPTISGAFSTWTEANGYATCPFGDCVVYLLRQDGTVIKGPGTGTLSLSEVKAVRSVGTKNVGTTADTSRAIEAAVAGGVNIIYCKQNGTDNSGAGWKTYSFASSDCGGTLPDSSYTGMGASAEICGGITSWRVLQPILGQNPGMSINAINACGGYIMSAVYVK